MAPQYHHYSRVKWPLDEVRCTMPKSASDEGFLVLPLCFFSGQLQQHLRVERQ